MAFGRAAAHPIYLPSPVSPSLALPPCFPLISSRTIVSGHAPTCSCQILPYMITAKAFLIPTITLHAVCFQVPRAVRCEAGRGFPPERPKTMKFCPNCNFILYPKEDKDERKLVYYCRSPRCDHEEDAPDPYVFRNQVIKTRTVNLDHVLSAVANDPTLQRSTADCPLCHYHEAVLIQSTQNVKSNKLTLIFVCCNPNCGHKWTDDDP